MKTNKDKQNRSLIFIIFIIIILSINVIILGLNYNAVRGLKKNKLVKEKIELNYTLPEFNITNNPLSLSGFTEVKINITDNTVILGANCTALGLNIHEFQLYSIRQGLDKSVDIRPTIHDTIVNVLENFNISLIMIKITDAKDDLYFSNIYFKSGNNLLNIDAKPSDAIALAVRTNVPVYIKESILVNYGTKIC
ncbi:bifunctional nuclease family protein [Candidatus Woesearchaeota archaeon]|nr:bifunctional nuclease family protein [Candidatus Woesearchaeota archaeon]